MTGTRRLRIALGLCGLLLFHASPAAAAGGAVQGPDCHRTVYIPCFDRCAAAFPGVERLDAWKVCITACARDETRCKWPSPAALLDSCRNRLDGCAEACPPGHDTAACLETCERSASICRRKATAFRPAIAAREQTPERASASRSASGARSHARRRHGRRAGPR